MPPARHLKTSTLSSRLSLRQYCNNIQWCLFGVPLILRESALSMNRAFRRKIWKSLALPPLKRSHVCIRGCGRSTLSTYSTQSSRYCTAHNINNPQVRSQVPRFHCLLCDETESLDSHCGCHVLWTLYPLWKSLLCHSSTLELASHHGVLELGSVDLFHDWLRAHLAIFGAHLAALLV